VHVLDAFWDHQSRDRLEDPCHQGQVHQPNQFYQGQDPLGDRGCHQNLRGGGNILLRRRSFVGKWRFS
jgi:hypothetical protein